MRLDEYQAAINHCDLALRDGLTQQRDPTRVMREVRASLAELAGVQTIEGEHTDPRIESIIIRLEQLSTRLHEDLGKELDWVIAELRCFVPKDSGQADQDQAELLIGAIELLTRAAARAIARRRA